MKALRDSRMLEEANWRTLYPDSKFVVTKEQVGDHNCYKIAMLAVPDAEFLSGLTIPSSGLLVRKQTSQNLIRRQRDRNS